MSVEPSVLLSVCQLHQFVVKFFVSNNFFLPPFSDTDRKFIGLCSNFFQPSWRHCFLRVRKINLKTNKCFDKLFYLFFHPSRTLNEKKGFYGEKPISRFVKPLTIPQGDPLKNFFHEEVLFCSSLTLEQFFFWHSDKIFSAVSPKLLCVCPLQQFVVKKILSKMFFSSIFGHSTKFCQLFSKLFRSAWQNCILRVRRIFLRT